jgi:hypothetical protein
MKQITSNQRYGGMNRRFDRRAAQLVKFGFHYTQIADGVAAFTRRAFWSKQQSVLAAVVLMADNNIWRDELARILCR